MKYVEMIINEETIDTAIEILHKSKGKRVLIAVSNLEEDSISPFTPLLKKECENMIRDAKSISSVKDTVISHQLRLYSIKQPDIKNIKPIGLQRTILLKD